MFDMPAPRSVEGGVKRNTKTVLRTPVRVPCKSLISAISENLRLDQTTRIVWRPTALFQCVSENIRKDDRSDGALKHRPNLVLVSITALRQIILIISARTLFGGDQRSPF